jgi:hypothetical protein
VQADYLRCVISNHSSRSLAIRPAHVDQKEEWQQPSSKKNTLGHSLCRGIVYW